MPKPQPLTHRRSKFFRPSRRQQMEELLGSKCVPARPVTTRATPCPPLLQGITRKRWSFRALNRLPAAEQEPSPSSRSSASTSSALSTSPSSFLPSAIDRGVLEPNGSSQMPLLTHHHVPRPKSDRDLAPADSTSQVPLLISHSHAPSSLPPPSPRRMFHLAAMRLAKPPSYPAPSTAPSSSIISPRPAATGGQDVLSIKEAHQLLPRLTQLRSRHVGTPRSHPYRHSSSSQESANAAPRKAMSRVDAFNSSRLSPASSAAAAPTAPFFELEDVTPDSQCGALRDWLAQPDEMSMDFRRGGVTGPLGSTAALTGALTGAITGGLHGLPHLPHTPPSCCSTQRASSLAVSPLRSLPPRRAGPALSSLNSSMMSSAAAGDDSVATTAALQAALTRSMTPQEHMRPFVNLDAHLDTITQEVTVESTAIASTDGAPSAALSAQDSEDLDAMSESTMGLDTAMLPSLLPSCSAAGPPRPPYCSSIATSLHGCDSQLSAVTPVPVAARAVESEACRVSTPPSPTTGSESGSPGASTAPSTPKALPPHPPASPPSRDALDAPSDVPSCMAAVLHQPSQLLSGQQDSCFDTVGSHRAHPLVWDSADAAPGPLECASEKHVSDSTIISYIDGTTGVGSPALLSCSDGSTTTMTSKCSGKVRMPPTSHDTGPACRMRVKHAMLCGVVTKGCCCAGAESQVDDVPPVLLQGGLSES